VNNKIALKNSGGSGGGSGSGVSGDYVPKQVGASAITVEDGGITLRNEYAPNQIRVADDTIEITSNNYTGIAVSDGTVSIRASNLQFTFAEDPITIEGFATADNPKGWTNTQLVFAQTIYQTVIQMFKDYGSHNGMTNPPAWEGE
jgi:hypothetical protein